MQQQVICSLFIHRQSLTEEDDGYTELEDFEEEEDSEEGEDSERGEEDADEGPQEVKSDTDKGEVDLASDPKPASIICFCFD